MDLLADLKTLYHLTLAPIRGQTHAERLESFYSGQAGAYDEFRERLLHGRRELFAAIPVPPSGIWVDMGGGTGSNVECLGDQLQLLQQMYVVDLASSLLTVAQQRIADRGWSNVATAEADACTFQPARGPVDVVSFSYSLTMIPDWFTALDHAWQLLRPGGLIGVVDFYVARKHPGPGHARHSWLRRTFWPIWFSHDNVFLNPDHVPYLHRRFEPVRFSECTARVPCLPGNVPYYIFIGRKGE